MYLSHQSKFINVALYNIFFPLKIEAYTSKMWECYFIRHDMKTFTTKCKMTGLLETIVHSQGWKLAGIIIIENYNDRKCFFIGCSWGQLKYVPDNGKQNYTKICKKKLTPIRNPKWSLGITFLPANICASCKNLS